MIWLNLKTTTLRSPEYAGSEPVQRATWLNLLAYCCEQENGGIMKGCGAWKDRQWQQTLGVTLAEVGEECALWTWVGDDLYVAFYPADKQEEVKAKREAGKRGGKRSGKARREAVREAQLEAVLQPQLEAHLERKGKEGEWKDKGMEDSHRESVWQEPTREQVIDAARKFGLTEQQAGIWYDEMKSRDIDRFGRWLDGRGNPIGNWQYALSAWAGRFKENNKPKGSTNGSNGSNGRERIERYRGVGDPSQY